MQWKKNFLFYVKTFFIAHKLFYWLCFKISSLQISWDNPEDNKNPSEQSHHMTRSLSRFKYRKCRYLHFSYVIITERDKKESSARLKLYSLRYQTVNIFKLKLKEKNSLRIFKARLVSYFLTRDFFWKCCQFFKHSQAALREKLMKEKSRENKKQ